MIRDERMSKLITSSQEPITPLTRHIRALYTQHNISSIVVIGGCGDYIALSDTVIMMDQYQPYNVTHNAHQISPPTIPLKVGTKEDLALQLSRQQPRTDNLHQQRDGVTQKSVKTRRLKTISVGKKDIDLTYVEQLVDIGQTRSIGFILAYYMQHYRALPVLSGIEHTLDDIRHKGLDIISEYKIGTLALPRLHEIMATINRIRV